MMKKKEELAKFNVLNWDFNRDMIYQYDVLPYFRECYRDKVKKFKQVSKRKWYAKADEKIKEWYKVPETYEEFKKFIEDQSRYQFWARCEYEMIVHGWPVRKNDYKIDIHEQVMMNLDIICKILWEEFQNERR